MFYSEIIQLFSLNIISLHDSLTSNAFVLVEFNSNDIHKMAALLLLLLMQGPASHKALHCQLTAITPCPTSSKSTCFEYKDKSLKRTLCAAGKLEEIHIFRLPQPRDRSKLTFNQLLNMYRIKQQLLDVLVSAVRPVIRDIVEVLCLD